MTDYNLSRKLSLAMKVRPRKKKVILNYRALFAMKVGPEQRTLHFIDLAGEPMPVMPVLPKQNA